MTCPLCEACEAPTPVNPAISAQAGCELCALIYLRDVRAEGAEQIQGAYHEGCVAEADDTGSDERIELTTDALAEWPGVTPILMPRQRS